jgi:hypothetical protein
VESDPQRQDLDQGTADSLRLREEPKAAYCDPSSGHGFLQDCQSIIEIIPELFRRSGSFRKRTRPKRMTASKVLTAMPC